MGLFDDIRFKYPLPEAFHEYQDEVFQTKDLECYMAEYEISEDGDLVYVKYGYRDLTEEEKDKYKDRVIAPIMVRDGTVEREIIPHHGDILVYTSVVGKWLELIVRFTHGKLESIIEYDDEMHKIRKYY